MIAVDREAAHPLQRQIYDAYRTAIVSGSLRSGERIPSTRLLATELGVSRFPVLNAYAQLLAEDNANVPALGGLARAYVETGALDQARQTLAMVPEAKQNDAAVAAARAALELAEQAKTLGPIDELEQKVAANPLDHQARFDLALALNGKGQRADALEHLIAIVKRDRKWNDDGARKQLVQFFDAWGPTDEATIDGRKRLSSILFA